MKRTHRTLLCTAFMALALPLSAADNSSQGNSSQYNQRDNQNSGSSSRQRMSSSQQASQQNYSVSKLMDSHAKSKDGQDLGEVEDLIINPQSGKIDYVVLGQGGILGIGEDRVPVPWQAVKFQSNGDLVVNQDKAKLKSAPSVKKDYSDFNQPAYTVTLYEFYAIPMNTGASESPGGSQHGQGSSTDLNSDHNSTGSGSSGSWNSNSSTNYNRSSNP